GHHAPAQSLYQSGGIMNTPIVIEGTIPLGRRGRASRPEANGTGSPAAYSLPSSRIPRIARLLALAWHVEGLVRSGTVASYAVAARLGHVSRARMSQIVSLLNLAPDLQEHLLFLLRPVRGRQALTLRRVLTVAAVLDWQEQRRRWRKLRRATSSRPRQCGSLPGRKKTSGFRGELPGGGGAVEVVLLPCAAARRALPPR